MYYSRLIRVFTSHSSFTFLALDIQRDDGVVRYITSHENGAVARRRIPVAVLLHVYSVFTRALPQNKSQKLKTNMMALTTYVDTQTRQMSSSTYTNM